MSATSIGGLAPVRNPAGHAPGTGQDQWAVEGVAPGQMVDAEDEFERARR